MIDSADSKYCGRLQNNFLLKESLYGQRKFIHRMSTSHYFSLTEEGLSIGQLSHWATTDKRKFVFRQLTSFYWPLSYFAQMLLLSFESYLMTIGDFQKIVLSSTYLFTDGFGNSQLLSFLFSLGGKI